MNGTKGRIVVGVDDSPGAVGALAWAIDEAARRDAKLDVIHAYRFEVAWIDEMSEHLDEWRAVAQGAAEEELRRIVGRLGETAAAPVEARAVEGPSTEVLLAAATDADLLVVGSRGRGGFAGLLLGSVSQRCIEHASCPVVVVPPPAS